MSSKGLDVLHLHGRDAIRLHDSFPDRKQWEAFLKDVAFNNNKSIKQINRGGSKKTLKCTDENCEWFVALSYRPKPKAQKASKLSHIQPKAG
ncbi:hypothetical protein L916_04366, partial [Phytophthora nicotianae]